MMKDNRAIKILKKEIYSNNEYYLTSVSDLHIENIRIWRNNQIDVLRQDKLIGRSEQISYYEKNIWPEHSREKPEQILLSFFYNDKLIGYGGLVHINWKKKEGEMSFLLDDVRMKNLKTYKEDLNNFILILREIFFNELNFKCMITETFSFRTETIKALESQNFRRYYPNSPRIKEKISSIFHLLMYEASSNRK